MTLLATTPVSELELVNTETGERRELEPDAICWPDDEGEYRLSGPVSCVPLWFLADGTPCSTKSPWRIDRRAVDADAELVKLARAEWTAADIRSELYINLRVQAHHAAVKAKAGDLSALDALILTPPVDPLPIDPLLVEARNMLADDHREGAFDFYHEGRMMKLGAGEEVILSGRFDKSRNQRRYHDALKRGLELAERGEG